MTTLPTIGFIGLGNLGWNVAHQFGVHDIPISQMVVRNADHAARLSEEFQCEVLTHPSDLDLTLDIVFITVSDDQINSVIAQLSPNLKAAIVHCSGSQEIPKHSNKTGVLYPFQTFTKGYRANWQDVHVFVDAEDDSLAETLLQLAHIIAKNTLRVSTEQRKAIHLSGVFACNFTNHLLTQASQLLSNKQLDFDILKPLVAETIFKAFDKGPFESQTGPARRRDSKLIKSHLDLLSEDDNAQSIYKLISESIMQTYS